MSLPTKQEFLNNLFRMKRDCIAFMEEAERRGDTREAREFREHLERVESMIDHVPKVLRPEELLIVAW